MLKRKYPIGAEFFPGRGVHFRVWAPDHNEVSLLLESRSLPMKKENKGYFSLLVPNAKVNSSYQFQLGKEIVPDPASRFQPEGVEGPSQIIDPRFSWKDQKWKGSSMQGQILYELHIGTFTKEGTFKAAIKKLPHLKKLGVTLIEIMPIASFPGRFGWGYDGVFFYAPFNQYGTPKDVKAFVNRAHQLELGVILDVVYNHVGPEHNPLLKFTHLYHTKKKTDWGNELNFAHPNVKEFFVTNAKYWMEEFHFDGLRLDATWWIHPESALKDLAHAKGTKKRVIIAENEPQNAKLIEKYGFDGIWNEDFHHTVQVKLTGCRKGYFQDYLGAPQEFVSLAKYGFLFQGQYHNLHKGPEGTPAENLPPESFIDFLENHDQVGNPGNGIRLHYRSHPGDYKAMCAYLLLGPHTPLLFQGQEFNASSPFYFFAEFSDKLNRLILKGRKELLKTFSLSSPSPNPSDLSTFKKSKLKWEECNKNAEMLRFFQKLIDLRKKDPVFKECQKILVDGAVLGPSSFLLRYFGKEKGDRLLIFNFGDEFILDPDPEPLLAPKKDKEWKLLWTSNKSRKKTGRHLHVRGHGVSVFC